MHDTVGFAEKILNRAEQLAGTFASMRIKGNRIDALDTDVAINTEAAL